MARLDHRHLEHYSHYNDLSQFRNSDLVLVRLGLLVVQYIPFLQIVVRYMVQQYIVEFDIVYLFLDYKLNTHSMFHKWAKLVLVPDKSS